ncbi:MAG: sigma-70 family RNA polymerase sigma factor [Bacteroidota bacterium]
MSDTYDLDALRAKDPKEFDRLVRAESGKVYRCVYRFVRDEEETAGLVQETFLQAILNIDRFRGDSKVSTWLCSIGINLARASLRKKKRYDTLEDEDLERLTPSFGTAGMRLGSFKTWDPSEVTERNDRVSKVRAAIDRLPDDYRTVILLRDIQGLSTAEASDMLDVSEGALRVRLHRARQALRTLLDPVFADDA